MMDLYLWMKLFAHLTLLFQAAGNQEQGGRMEGKIASWLWWKEWDDFLWENAGGTSQKQEGQETEHRLDT